MPFYTKISVNTFIKFKLKKNISIKYNKWLLSNYYYKLCISVPDLVSSKYPPSTSVSTPQSKWHCGAHYCEFPFYRANRQSFSVKSFQ